MLTPVESPFKSEQYSTVWMDHILGIGSSISGHWVIFFRIMLLCMWVCRYLACFTLLSLLGCLPGGGIAGTTCVF